MMAENRAKVRYFRAEDELWEGAQERAASENTNLSVLLRTWLERYVNRDPSMSLHAEVGRIIDSLSDVQRRLGEEKDDE